MCTSCRKPREIRKPGMGPGVNSVYKPTQSPVKPASGGIKDRITGLKYAPK